MSSLVSIKGIIKINKQMLKVKLHSALKSQLNKKPNQTDQLNLAAVATDFSSSRSKNRGFARCITNGLSISR